MSTFILEIHHWMELAVKSLALLSLQNYSEALAIYAQTD